MRALSRTFRAVKNRNPNSLKLPSSSSSATSIRSSQAQSNPSSKSRSRSWSVYLIISTNPPNQNLRWHDHKFFALKQHNGELKGGAKASRAGRPWIPACIIQGFHGQNDACEFESKWKSISRKLPRSRKNSEDRSIPLLQHRQIALDRVKAVVNCSHLQIDWKLDHL